MGLIFWWILLGWLSIIVGYWVVKYILWRNHKASPEVAVPIAHSDRLTNLPAYKAALKQYRFLLWIASGATTLALILAMLLSARPATVALITPAQQNRDVMLCLDVSGSVLKADATIVNRFSALVDSFDGQRVGLTVFNSSSVAIVPLSDDYQFINEQLTKVGAALKEQKGQAFTDLTSGTLADFDKGTSLVSDGIGSCISNLGTNSQRRSQSIILATDNEANGTPIITMTQAIALAENKQVRIYAIDPGESETARAGDHTQLKSQAEKTGGGYYMLRDAEAVNAIISEISKQEAKYAAGGAVVAVADNPDPFMYVAVVATIATLALAWRLHI